MAKEDRTYGFTIYGNDPEALEAWRNRLALDLLRGNVLGEASFDIDNEVMDYGESWEEHNAEEG